MEKFCVVIPIYKQTLDCVEEISLKQLYKVIGEKNYCVYLVCPEELDVSEYQKLYDNKLHICYFDKKYFTSTAAYSQLCINYEFYNTFSNFEYMLIYQLDCYLFNDDIEKWCNMNYDYIGAPIISTDCGWDTVKKANENSGKKWTPYVGNGGFSLRKISTFKEICDPNGELRTYYKLTDEKLEGIAWEDKYFCNDLFNFYKLNVPDWTVAIHFAFDMSVDVIYNIFKYQGLPMGIHSVDKNIRWWKKVIPEFSTDEIVNYCEKKHEAFFKLYYDENDSTIR